MYREKGRIALASGEQVEVGVVIGPDVEWAERVEKLLGHKGDPWNWQNHEVLMADVGIDTRFYVLHRRGMPFANIMTAEYSGVGILGHVWTNPEDRGKGACSTLMNVLIEDFTSRQGKALFLGTGYDSIAYHIYARFGFKSVEARSGFMEWYATSRSEFEATYFKKAETEIQPVGWAHWPSSPALFLGDFPGLIRCAPLKLIGRQSTESPLLPLFRAEKKRQAARVKPCAMVLRNQVTTAVVGFTAWDWHPLWEGTCLVDVYCHPNYWDEAGNLLRSLSLPDAEQYLAYNDIDCRQKAKVLLDEDFLQTAVNKRRVSRAKLKTSFLDIDVFEKETSVNHA